MATKNVTFTWHSCGEEPTPNNRKTYLVQLLWTERDGEREAVCTTVAKFHYVYDDVTGTEEPRWLMPGTGPEGGEIPLEDSVVAWGELPNVMSATSEMFDWGYLSPSEFFEILDSY